MRRQVLTCAMAAVAVGALVGGCGAGPSQVGSAVIIGSATVPSGVVQDRVQQTLARADVVEQLAARGVGSADIARDIVTQAVVHELAGRAAADAGVVVTDAEVDARLAMLGGPEAVRQRTPFPLDLFRERLGDELIAARLAAQQVNGLAVTVDLIGLGSREEAERAAHALAAGGTAADALFTASPETSLRGFEYRAAESPEVAASPLFGAPVGAAGWFQPRPGQDSWLAFRILDRRSDAQPVPPEQDAVASIGQDGLAEIGIRLLQPVAAAAGVRVNPRYGVWDPLAMRVVGADDVTGMVLPPSAP